MIQTTDTCTVCEVDSAEFCSKFDHSLHSLNWQSCILLISILIIWLCIKTSSPNWWLYNINSHHLSLTVYWCNNRNFITVLLICVGLISRSMQEVHLDKHVKLLDSPGIVMDSGNSDSAVILRNCVKVQYEIIIITKDAACWQSVLGTLLHNYPFLC